MKSSNNSSEVAIIRPKNDLRSYQYLRLHNGVRALLIQDSNVNFAAASACVQAGYFDDPDEAPGCAHLLEHAVHLGSTAYPGEAEYKAYLASHKGSSNASTGMAYTTYHITLAADGLAGGLDRLAAALASPLLDGDAMLREAENVHAEYSRNTNADSRKLLQLRRSAARKPLSRFSTGNITTLRDAPLEAGVNVPALVQQLWRNTYCADSTTVSVLGPQPLEELGTMLQDAFAQLPAAQGSTDCRYIMDVADASTQGRLFKVLPQRDLRSLELSWAVPFGTAQYRDTKPWSWASHVAGHEGHGSVAAALKRAGLIQTLSAGLSDEVHLGRGFMFWSISIELTEMGLERWQDVVAAVFQGIQVMRLATESQRQSIWLEAQQTNQLRFDFRDPFSPVETVKDTAAALHKYPAHQVLSGGRLLTAYDAEAINTFLSYLGPERLNIFLSSRSLADEAVLREPWYGARYGVEAISEDFMTRLQATKESTTPSLHFIPQAPHIYLPHPNWALALLQDNPPTLRTPKCVIATDQLLNSSSPVPPAHYDSTYQVPSNSADVVPIDNSSPERLPNSPGFVEPLNGATTADQLLGSSSPMQPSNNTAGGHVPSSCSPVQLTGFTDSSRAWYKDGLAFQSPMCHAHIHLVSPALHHSVSSWIAAKLLRAALEDAVEAELYPAILVGMNYDVHLLQTGLHIHVAGFPSLVPGVLERLVAALENMTRETLDERFRVLHGRLEQKLRVWHHKNPGEHAEYGVTHALTSPHWHHTDQLNAALQISDPALVLDLKNAILSACKMGNATALEALYYGAVTEMEAVEMHRKLVSTFKPGGLDHAVWPEPRVFDLKELKEANLKRVNDLTPTSLSTGNVEPSANKGSFSDGNNVVVAEARVLDLKEGKEGDLSLGTETALASSSNSNVETRQSKNASAVLGDAVRPGPEVVDLKELKESSSRIDSEVPALQEVKGNGEGILPTVSGQVMPLGGMKNGEPAYVSAEESLALEKLQLASRFSAVLLRYVPVNPNPGNSNSAMYLYVQVCHESDVRSCALLELFCSAASKPAFHSLRTVSRLGYSVSAFHDAQRRLHGFAVRIQSATHGPDQLSAAALQWLAGFRAELEGIVSRDLPTLVASITARWREPARGPEEAAQRLWHHVERRTYQFDRREQLAKALESVTASELFSFYDIHLAPSSPSFRALVCQIQGAKAGTVAAVTTAAAASGNGSAAAAAATAPVAIATAAGENGSAAAATTSAMIAAAAGGNGSAAATFAADMTVAAAHDAAIATECSSLAAAVAPDPTVAPAAIVASGTAADNGSAIAVTSGSTTATAAATVTAARNGSVGLRTTIAEGPCCAMKSPEAAVAVSSTLASSVQDEKMSDKIMDESQPSRSSVKRGALGRSGGLPEGAKLVRTEAQAPALLETFCSTCNLTLLDVRTEQLQAMFAGQ